MTVIQKEKVRYLRGEGLGYKAIASRLALSVDAVKGFCRRSGLDCKAAQSAPTTCRQCGKPLAHKSGSGQKKFCSAPCRSAWWSGHAYLYNHKEENKRACAHCGRVFYSFHSKERKYCGHSCYIRARFGEVNAHEAGAV